MTSRVITLATCNRVGDHNGPRNRNPYPEGSLSKIRTRHLFTMRLDTNPIVAVGATPEGFLRLWLRRRIVQIGRPGMTMDRLGSLSTFLQATELSTAKTKAIRSHPLANSAVTS
jgi:hypothetical protein